MERHLSIPIGIIIERCATDSLWQSYVWRTAEAVIGEASLVPGSRIRHEGITEAYFAGTATLDLHPTDIASYRDNLQQDIPRIYVVLAAEDEEPPQVHLVTAAPEEAESYLDGDPTLVDSVPMPASLIELISTYIDAHELPGDRISRRFRRSHGGAQSESGNEQR